MPEVEVLDEAVALNSIATPVPNMELVEKDGGSNLDSSVARLVPLAVAQAQSISTAELKEIACGYCDQKFSKSRDRTDHIKFFHPEINPYACYYCNKSFTTNDNFTQHINSVHEGKKHLCSYCYKSFTENGYLKKHIASSHEGKGYSCSYCGKSFTVNGSLTVHIASVHKSAKYWCDYCGKFFTQNGHLKIHIDSVHLGKKHPCIYCNKPFTTKDSLTRHVKSQHSRAVSSGQVPQLISITTPLSLLSTPTPNSVPAPNVELEKGDETTQASFDQEKSDVVAEQEYKETE